MSPRSALRWLERAAAAVHVRLYRTLGGALVGRGPGGVELLVLTTTGRRSGVPRTVVVGYVRHGEGVLISTGSASGRVPAWLHNLRACPDAVVQIGRYERRVTAVEAAGDDLEARWSAVVTARPIYRLARRPGNPPPPVVQLAERDQRSAEPSCGT